MHRSHHSDVAIKRIWRIIWIWLVAGLVSPLCQASIFEDQSLLEIGLTGPLWSLIDKKEERKEWPFHLLIGQAEIDLKVRARGNSRMRLCDFPPLRLNFKEADTLGTPFLGQDKLKLVTRCKKGDRYEKDVLEEYAAYRIFSLLSDVSYRVRLVHLTYTDTDGQLAEAFRESYGYLIEPLEQLASRVGGHLPEMSAVQLKWLDEKQAARVYVFEYLIANTDWSFVKADGDENCCHNIELVKIEPKIFPVPYDFDLAGLVNAAYAKPDRSLRIDKVSKRMYRGFCTGPEILRETLKDMLSKKAGVLDIIAGLPLLTEKEKNNRIDYLGKFFNKARDEDKMIAMFEKRCLS